MDPPSACLSEHPEALTDLDAGYPERDADTKARDELAAKIEDRARHRALWLDHAACRRWIEDERRAAIARAERERRGDQ